MADSRANKTNVPVSRAARSAVAGKATNDPNALTDTQRLDMFRQQMYQSALPELPRIPGYHTCYLTTTNPRDSIAWRMRLGYELLQLSDFPEYSGLSVKTGEYDGCIGVNEMLMAKLPNNLYQAYMTESFHTQPMQEEARLSSVVDAMQADAAARGIRRVSIHAESGTAQLGKRVPRAPNFLEPNRQSRMRAPDIDLDDEADASDSVEQEAPATIEPAGEGDGGS